MDRLNPCLNLVLEVRQALEAGESARSAVKTFAKQDEAFSLQCGRWLMLLEKGGDAEIVLHEIKSPHRKTLLRLLERSFRGEPVFSAVCELESEIVSACRLSMDEHLALLPMKLMIPLLLMIFPSLMILLFGPLLESLATGFTAL